MADTLVIDYFELADANAEAMRDAAPLAANDPYIIEEYLVRTARSWQTLVNAFNVPAEGEGRVTLVLERTETSIALQFEDATTIVKVEPQMNGKHILLTTGHGAMATTCQFRTAYGGGMNNLRDAYMGAIRQVLHPSETYLYEKMSPADYRAARQLNADS